MRTRSASKPRITGRDALGPNWVAVTPGMPLSVSPKVLSRRKLSSRPFRTDTGTTNSSDPTPSGLPVTETGATLISGFAGTFFSAPQLGVFMTKQLAKVAEIAIKILLYGIAGLVAFMRDNCLLDSMMYPHKNQ